jgi:hypothetical protein
MTEKSSTSFRPTESEAVLRVTAALYDLGVTDRPKRWERRWWSRLKWFSVRLEIAKYLEDVGVIGGANPQKSGEG